IPALLVLLFPTLLLSTGLLIAFLLSAWLIGGFFAAGLRCFGIRLLRSVAGGIAFFRRVVSLLRSFVGGFPRASALLLCFGAVLVVRVSGFLLAGFAGGLAGPALLAAGVA